MSDQKKDRRRAVALVMSLLSGLGWTLLPAVGISQQPAAPRPGTSPLTIEHDPLNCVTTELAPLVDAQVAPVPQFEVGYVYFKAAGTDDFYYTPMKGPAQNLEGTLPRPLPETKAIDYKVRARDVAALVAEKGEYTPPVVPGSACKAKGMPVGKNGAGLTIGLTREGQDPVPRGFNRRDIAFVILFSGATVTLAQALAGTGGGSTSSAAGAAKAGGGNKGLWIAGGAAVVAGAAIAVANSNKSSNTATPLPTSTPTPTPSPTPTPTVAFQFVEADATWSGAGDVNVQILNSSGQAVGTTLPAGCESIAQRTERVLLQGPPAGDYRVMLSAKTCGSFAPSSIAVVLSVQSSGQPKCPNTFVNVPVGGSVNGCTFTLP